MRLNPDCIRDILFTVEDESGFGKFVQFNDNKDFVRLEKYSLDEVLYHIQQCEHVGFLTKVDWFIDGSCLIYDLSPSGHEFLANIRADTNWNKVKQTAKNVGSESLSVLGQIAGQVISAMLTQGRV